MSRKMLINALHAEEARVAIVEDGRLVDLDVEIAGNEQIRGNIYKGVVVRVEQGLQAAFVDVGLKKLGFLQMGELHPENWKWRDDIPEDQRHRRPRIQEVLRRGQELLVQVEKGERDNKGSALTTYVSLPGRYMVLMPGSDSSGISRKVESESERKKLKEIISEMTIPEGYGYIIRTEAMGRTRDELQKDLDSLIALYEGVRDKGAAMKGAGLIYQESALIIRTIRDYFSADIDEVLVDSKDVYQDVRECLKEIDPQFEKLVKMHQEKRPIFSRYQLEEQIDLIYEKKVPLKSGGSIFIEPTEALVSIDVNSGKSTGEKGVEDTAFKTNMEAAEEAARQLRLRDLGGLIVIDFIDMRDRKHNAEVEKTLKTALKADKARVNVARISEFGLLEMSRQRIRQTLNQASSLECPHCDGRGKVKSVEAMALSFLRKVHAAAAKGTIAEVVGSLPLEVAYYLLNRKRHELSQIENDYDIEVTVKGKPSFLLNQMELELLKREKLPQEETPERIPSRPYKEEAQPQESAEGRGKKKRKTKPKAHQEVEPAAGTLPVPAAATVAATEPVLATLAAEETLGGEPLPQAETEEHKKKRRRKRKRGKGGAEAGGAEAAAAGEAGEEAAPALAAGGSNAQPADDAAPAEAGSDAAGGEEGKKKRRRKRRRGKGGHDAAAAEGSAPREAGGETAESATEQPSQAAPAAAAGNAEPKAKKARPARGKKTAEQGAAEAPLAAQAPAPQNAAPNESSAAAAQEPAAAKPSRRSRPQKAKPAAGEAAVTENVAVRSEAPAPQSASPAQTPESKPARKAQAPKAPKEAKPAKSAEPAQEAKPAKEAKPARAPKAAKPAKNAAAPAVESAASAKPAAPAAAGEPAAGTAKKAPARKKTAAAAPAGAEQPIPGAEPQAKKPRAPRKKKEDSTP
jgi:ribonuclease E